MDILTIKMIVIYLLGLLSGLLIIKVDVNKHKLEAYKVGVRDTTENIRKILIDEIKGSRDVQHILTTKKRGE